MNRVNSTRLTEQEELIRNLTEIDLYHTNTCKEAGIPLMVKNGKAYVDTQDNHTIIFGATGSKKTRLFVMPSVDLLTRAGESFVVTDPKGEIYERTIHTVRKRGYQIYCLNLRDFHKGLPWNPLALPYDYYHSDKKNRALEMVNEFVNQIGLGTTRNEDPFWGLSMQDVVVGLIMILLEGGTKEECTVKNMILLWERYLKDREEMMDIINEKYAGTMIARKMNSLNSDSSKTVGSIEAIVTTALNRLASNEEFIDLLSQNTMGFDRIIQQKTAIYLIIPDENSVYHFIAGLFMEQLYEVLIKEAQRHPQCRLPIRMNYIIDEFANIPKLNNMDSMITASRSRNIRFNLIVQSKMQLESKYDSLASVICDNCTNWIYLYSKDYGLLNEISRLCGNVIYDNHMTIPLISEFDLQHLKKEEGEALLLSGRNYPCIVNLADVDEYPELRLQEDTGDLYQYCQWQKPVEFHIHKHWNRFICHERNRKQPEKIIENNTWIVGVLNDMIVVNCKANTKEVNSGMAMLAVCHNVFGDMKTAGLLKWYTGTPDAYGEYKCHEVIMPNEVFAMLSDFERDSFLPVEDSIMARLKGVAQW